MTEHCVPLKIISTSGKIYSENFLFSLALSKIKPVTGLVMLGAQRSKQKLHFPLLFKLEVIDNNYPSEAVFFNLLLAVESLFP